MLTTTRKRQLNRRKERRNSEIGLGRENPREKAARPKKTLIFGGLASAVRCGEVAVLRRAGIGAVSEDW